MHHRKLIFASIVGFAAMAPLPAHAAHHLWRLVQVYSNADGSVQFIELETTTTGRTGETSVTGFTVTSSSTTTPFTFSHDLTPVGGSSGPTQWLLLGTANLASQPGGVTPDFIIPANFFSTGGVTLNYATGADTWTFGTVPTDGIHSLTRDPTTMVVTTTVNAPINLAGTAGQIGAAATTPAATSWSLALAMGALLLAGSGLLRRRSVGTA